MLVIDRVKLALRDHVHGIRKLQHSASLWRQQFAQAGDEVVCVRRMREDVVRQNQISRLFSGQFAREWFGEKIHARVDAASPRNCRNIVRRLNPQMRHTGLGKVPKEIAIVASDLYHVLRGEFLLVSLRALGGVCHPRIGVGREINVLAEKFHRRHEIGDLQQPAFGTYRQPQRKAGFGLIQIFR